MKIKFLLILSLFILAQNSFAVTRFYLPGSGTAEVSPTFEAGWGNTAVAKRIRCTTVLSGTVMTTEVSPQVAVATLLFRQYVSDPLTADYTFPGNVRGYVLCSESSNASNSTAAVAVKVVSNDGTIVRGIVLPLTFEANSVTGAEFPTGAVTNRRTPTTLNINSVTALKGDRVVIEVGYNSSNPSGKTSSMRFGDNGTTDLPEDTTTQDGTMNPWIEFGQEIPINQSAMIIE